YRAARKVEPAGRRDRPQLQLPPTIPATALRGRTREPSPERLKPALSRVEFHQAWLSAFWPVLSYFAQSFQCAGQSKMLELITGRLTDSSSHKTPDLLLLSGA